MARLRALPCLLAFAFALPCTARAGTVEVTIHTSGSMDANPLVLYALGLDTSTTDRLPFDLTISSSFDSANLVDSAGGPYANAAGAELQVSFQLGAMTYRYAGTGGADVRLYDAGSGRQGYQLQIGFGPAFNNNLLVRSVVIAPAGSFGASPLSPLSLGAGPGLAGFASVGAYPSNPDAPGFWTMSADADRFSLQVTSPVPEPAPFGMLAAGMFILGGWRLRRLFSARR